MQTLPDTPLPLRLLGLLLVLSGAVAALVMSRSPAPGPYAVSARPGRGGALMLTIDRAADYPDYQPGGAMVTGATVHMVRNPALGWMWRSTGSTPNGVGWRISVPRAGRYALRVRYAAEESRPMEVLVDGEVRLLALRQPTGSRRAAAWFDEGSLDLTPGIHRLALHSVEPTPSIDVVQLVLAAR